MGMEQLALSPSLQSLTHALGLDDDSVEVMITSKTSEGGHGCFSSSSSLSRPASFVSSIESCQRSARCCRPISSISRSPYMSTNPSDQEASEVDFNHLACLGYCHVAGSSTCSASTPALTNILDSSDNFSTRSTIYNLHRNSTLRSRKLPSEKRSSCSLMSLSSKALPFSSRFLRKRRERCGDAEKATWSHLASDVHENPAFAAINAGLSGMPFADMTLVCAADGLETHVHSSIVSSVCPMFMQKIQANNTVNLDIQTYRQSSDSSSMHTGQLKKSKSRWIKPLGCLRGAKGSMKSPPDDGVNLDRQGCNGSIVTKSSLSLDCVFKSLDKTSNSQRRRIQVTGCNGSDLRAFFFYLYTGQFRLVPSHDLVEVDDSNAFRGHFNGNLSSSASDCDETAWDPTRIRKSRSLRNGFFSGKEDGSYNRRLSSHTILSQQTTLHGPSASSSSMCSFATPHPHNMLWQDNTSQAPPFSVQGAYHLSQVFNLSRLAFASLSFFLQRVTLTNALQYYISPFAMAYPSVQSACLDYLVKHWSAVSAQTQSQTILGRLAAGWYPQANMALFQLLAKVE